MDGTTGDDYHHRSGLVQFFSMYQLMPESILVGMAHVDRQRDFTRQASSAELLEALSPGGGSAAFPDFIKQELQPFLDAEYQTSGR